MSTPATVKTHREPLLHTVKHAERSGRQTVALRLAAVALSLVAGGIFILAIGQNPFAVYATIVKGAFRSPLAIQATIKYTIPLCICALGVTLAFKMRFWNIGGEGQLIMGGVFASWFALFCTDWPHPLLLAVMFVAGAIGGGLWGLLPAVFKSRWNTNETLFTLMLNYIALHIVSWLQSGPWRDEGANGFNKIARFDKNAGLDKVLGVHFGWIIMLVLVVLVWVYLKYTKQGYEISVVGESQDTARYAGIHVKKVVLRTMFLSGAIAGIAGVCQVGGSDMTLSMGVAGGVGFTAIIVAWLCQLNPGMILVVSFLFSVLEKGSGVVQSEFGLSADSADVLQGVILFFILASEFFVRYGFALRKKQPKGGQ
ncbi:MAG TPA: ABC transporter permease [Candidatus Fournierella excrementavium]|uniref:ABC transporter permease n=1 Tax=Candidatus Allofournierella excrementavium TaxID=2838591 RepID=UPI0015AFB19C|nr:ABC transporter permease [Candidatus Fournierella excrementavium]